jgi:prepilin-type N-terminal cleavage/methylation domain-containing protein
VKRNKLVGFSLLEVIAAVVILAVVAAATVATVAPMRAKSEDKLTDRELATLNALAQSYHLQEGQYPASIDALAKAGHLRSTTADERVRVERIRRNYNYSPVSGVFSKRQ